MANTDTVSSLAQNAANQLGWNSTFIEKQWAEETGNFTSNVWKTDNNPAGIKWYPGMTYGTKGSAAPDGGNYAHFSNPVSGYVNFINNNPRYSNVKNSKDPYTEAQTIAQDGWAQDPNYASKIMRTNANGNQTVNVSPNSSSTLPGLQQTAFGLPDIQSLLSKGLGVVVGAGIVFIGLWALMNPLSDLTTAITTSVKQISKQPFKGATNAVYGATDAVKKQGIRKSIKQAPNAIKQHRAAKKEERKLDKQEREMARDLKRMEKRDKKYGGITN